MNFGKKMKVLLPCMVLAGSTSATEIDYTGLERVFGEPVTTSATGQPQRVSEAPVSMDIISTEDIRRSGAIDIPELLRRLVGVDVSRNFNGHADVNIRGYNQPLSNRLLVLINGRQVYMDNFGMTMWHSFPVQLAEVKQIEVVRGPNSSLFGFNAASGVVNIITFNPLFDDIDVVEARFGEQRHYEGSLTTTFKAGDKTAFRLSGGSLRFDGFSRDAASSLPEEDAATDKAAFNLDGVYKISDRSSLRLETGINDNDGDMTTPYYAPTKMESTTRHYRLLYSYDSPDFGNWTAEVYHNDLDFGFRTGGGLDSSNRLTVLKLRNLFMLGARHSFLVGTEYRENSLKGEFLGLPKGEFDMDIFSLNGTWVWKVHDNVSLTNAVRLDCWDTNQSGNSAVSDTFLSITPDDYERQEREYSFNSSLLFRPEPAVSYRLSVARGLHIPSLIELGQSSAFPAIEFYGNPRLDPESNLTIELGHQRSFPRTHINIEGTIFYQRLEDVIQPTVRTLGVFGGNGGAVSDLTFENVGESEAYGLELAADGMLLVEELKWFAGYSLIRITDDPDDLPDHFIDFENTQPRHKVSMGLSYTRGRWEVDTDVHVVSSTDYSGSVADVIDSRRNAHTDLYTIVNARLGYRLFEETFLSLDVYNLVDEHVERPELPITGVSGTTLAGGNKLERTILVTVHHRF